MYTKKQNLVANLIIIFLLGIVAYYMRNKLTAFSYVSVGLTMVVMMIYTINSEKYAVYNYPAFVFFGFIGLLLLWSPEIIANKDTSSAWIMDNINECIHNGSILKGIIYQGLICIGIFVISCISKKWYINGIASIAAVCSVLAITGHYLFNSKIIDNYNITVMIVAGFYVAFFKDTVTKGNNNIRSGIPRKNIVCMIIILNLFVGVMFAYSSNYITNIINSEYISEIIQSLIWGKMSAAILIVLVLCFGLCCNHREYSREAEFTRRRINMNMQYNENAMDAWISIICAILIFHCSWDLFKSVTYCYIGIASIVATSIVGQFLIDQSDCTCYKDILFFPHVMMAIVFFTIGLWVFRGDLIDYIFGGKIMLILTSAVITAAAFVWTIWTDKVLTVIFSSLAALMLIAGYNVSLIPVVCIIIAAVFGIIMVKFNNLHLLYVIVVIIGSTILNYMSVSGIRMEYIFGDESLSDSGICFVPVKSINENEKILFRWNDEEPIAVSGNEKYYFKTKDGKLSVSTVNVTGEVKEQVFTFKHSGVYEGEQGSFDFLN